MISPASAGSANSASDWGKSDRVVSAFCFITGNKDFAVGAELTVLLMMEEANRLFLAVVLLCELLGSHRQRRGGERKQHFSKVFYSSPTNAIQCRRATTVTS